MNSTQWLSILLSVLFAVQHASAAPTAKDVPNYRVRVRVISVQGKAPAPTQVFGLTLAGNAQSVRFAGSGWSAWVSSTRAGIEQALAAYNNANNPFWQVTTSLSVAPATPTTPFPTLTLQVQSAVDGGETSTTPAELFGPNVGVILWRTDGDQKVHIDTYTGHGRRVYDQALKAAFLPEKERPKKIMFGERYIGSDDDFLSWQEGIRRLAGLGFNALHTVPAHLTATVRAAGIHRIWGAVYNPPGYAFHFGPQRHAEFTKFVQDQVNPQLAAGWQKEDIGFWVTSDEPGWYYPARYTEFNQEPNALAEFHRYLHARGLTPASLGKKSWNEVRLIGRRDYQDLPSRRLFYWSNRFVPWASARYFGEVAKAYEEVIRPQVPVLVNFNNFMGLAYQPGPVGNNSQGNSPNAAMGQHDWLEFGRARGTTAIATEDWFGDDMAPQWSFYASRLRAAAELGGVGMGALVIPRVAGQRPAGMAQKLLALVGNGAKTIQFFTYGPEYAFPGNCYSENLPVFKPLATGMRLVGKAEDLLYPGRAKVSPVAILTPQSSPLWDLEEHVTPPRIIDVTNPYMDAGRMAYMVEMHSLFLALQHSAVPVRFVDEQKLTDPDFQATKVLYLTAPDLPAESAAAVLEWVRKGGTLVTVAGAAGFDRYHQPLPTLLQAAGIAPAAPVRMPAFQYADATRNGQLQAATALPVFGEREKLTLLPGAAPARPLARFSDGTPALTERVLGRGRILRFACYPGLSYRHSAAGNTGGLPSGFDAGWRQLIVQPVRDARAELPVRVTQPLVEAPALYSPAGVAVTLLNWRGTAAQSVDVSVATDRPVRRVVSAQRGPLPFRQSGNHVTVTLPLGDVDVLQLYY
ncbi:hypothetical protein DNI29_09595 [Hymenobacter sediminis]|uniref:hypothetical protein n=1 Tax=Hymenobacter sediminis TaxID=2218621 RepID=UPI000F4E4969|nr:hypothetical protein [Hymenobacter sediminis]RPD47692.1 hypothetical protein DNI29_09595 [Hymenobacter sediminis]